MADYTNNSKYAAEVWIENGKEEGFKTAFLNALFHQWQGHSGDEQNPKFNADMVDGKHYKDISDAISDAVANTVKNFYIGYTYFTGDADKHYILGSESVCLYPSEYDIEIPAGFDTYQEYCDSIKFPWNSTEEYVLNTVKESDNPNIYQIIKEMYYQLQDDLDKKTDESDFLAFKSDQEEFNSQFDNFHFTEDGVDASSVNGLRFYIVTQEEYEQLSDSSKKNIHNIYIIKEQEDITAYYQSIGENRTTYDNNPGTAPWDRAYEFKVDYATYNGEENVLCLMYKLTIEGDDEWKVIAPAGNFIDETTVRQIMQNNISNVSGPLNKKDFIDSVLTLNPYNLIENKETILAFPTSKVYDERYIQKGYQQTYTYNSDTDTISAGQRSDVPIITEGRVRILDIATPLSSLKTALDNKISSIRSIVGKSTDDKNQQTLVGKSKKAEENIASLQNLINNTRGGSTKSIANLDSSITDLKNYVDSKTLTINTNLNNWERFWIGGYIYPKGATSSQTNKWLDKIENKNTNVLSATIDGWSPYYYVSQVYINRTLGIGRLYLSFPHWHKASEAGKWVRPHVVYKEGKKTKTKTWWYYNRDILNNRTGKKIKQNATQDPPAFYGQQQTTTTLSFKDNNKYIAQPFATMVFSNALVPDKRFIKIVPNDGGNIYVMSTETSTKRMHFYATILYPLASGPTGATFDIEDDSETNTGEED